MEKRAEGQGRNEKTGTGTGKRKQQKPQGATNASTVKLTKTPWDSPNAST